MIGYRGSIEGARNRLADSKFVSEIYGNLYKFIKLKIKGEPSNDKGKYCDLMLTFLYHGDLLIDADEYDNRYFYVDENHKGQYVCGFVRKYMMAILSKKFKFSNVISSSVDPL